MCTFRFMWEHMVVNICYISWGIKGKGFPYSLPSVGPGADPNVQVVSPQVTMSHPPNGRLPFLSVRPVVTFDTFPAAEHHRPLAGTELYCLITEVCRCEQLTQGCYTAFAPNRVWTPDLLIASPALYPLRHPSGIGVRVRSALKTPKSRLQSILSTDSVSHLPCWLDRSTRLESTPPNCCLSINFRV